jgi:hypothetical protein
MHLSDGQLRSCLDQESSAEENRHLEGCKVCRSRLAEIRRNVELAGRALSFMEAGVEDRMKPVPSAEYELTRLKERVNQKEKTMQNIFRLLKNRLVWGSTAAVLLAAAFLSVPTMRAAATDILALFRVQKVAVLPLDPTGLSNFTGDSNLSEKLSQVIADSVVQTKAGGDPRIVGSVEEASQAAGFSLRLPAHAPAEAVLYVQDSSAFEINIDREKAQAFIDETGRSDIVLPGNIDGRQIRVEIPAGITASYGSCPRPDEEGELIDPDDPASTGRAYPDCIMMVEFPSPVVAAPEDLDVGQLVELGLELYGLNPEEARQLRESIDWTSTLVIPIPRNASHYEQVSVDGESGVLIQRKVDSNPHYLLAWVKDGIIYSISGWGTDSSLALEMANSLN